MIFSNTVTLGLTYDTSQQKLTLTLVEAKVLPISIKYNPGELCLQLVICPKHDSGTQRQDFRAFAVSYYGKVTLFGDGRVVKAKKTRPVASQRRQEQQQTSSSSRYGH